VLRYEIKIPGMCLWYFVTRLYSIVENDTLHSSFFSGPISYAVKCKGHTKHSATKTGQNAVGNNKPHKKWYPLVCLDQRFSNFFSSGDHFYRSECSTDHPSLVPLESKLFEILNYSVWYAIHVNFIFSLFFGLMFNLRGPQGQNPRTTCGPRTTVWETLV
jgi:hypothetical protein